MMAFSFREFTNLMQLEAAKVLSRCCIGRAAEKGCKGKVLTWRI